MLSAAESVEIKLEDIQRL